MEELYKLLADCTLCPRNCHVNRIAGEKGYCRESAGIMAARAALHMWEEPCISGEKGSGAVFFSGCSLQCVYCQNHDIAGAKRGRMVSGERLSEIFMELQEKGAANLNLVTAGHYVPQVVNALRLAREKGFCLPVIYNSSGYEKAGTLKLLEGYVDIYLPDFKYWEEEPARRYSNAPYYRGTAEAALAEMFRQTGECRFDEDGYIQKGMIVRHLVLPGQVSDSKKIVRYLYETYGDQIYISIMNQYTPLEQVEDYPEIHRKITEAEYDEAVDYAVSIGVTNGFIQEGETAKESFIPAFDCEGIEKNNV